MKIKNQKILKNGSIGAYVYQPDKTWKWRIIGKQKGSGSKENNSPRPISAAEAARRLEYRPISAAEAARQLEEQESLRRAQNVLWQLSMTSSDALRYLDFIHAAGGEGGGGGGGANAVNHLGNRGFPFDARRYRMLLEYEADIRRWYSNREFLNITPNTLVPTNSPKENKPRNNRKLKNVYNA